MEKFRFSMKIYTPGRENIPPKCFGKVIETSLIFQKPIETNHIRNLLMYPCKKEMLNSSKVKEDPIFYMNFNMSFPQFGPLKVLHFFPT